MQLKFSIVVPSASQQIGVPSGANQYGRWHGAQPGRISPLGTCPCHPDCASVPPTHRTSNGRLHGERPRMIKADIDKSLVTIYAACDR